MFSEIFYFSGRIFKNECYLKKLQMQWQSSSSLLPLNGSNKELNDDISKIQFERNEEKDKTIQQNGERADVNSSDCMRC